MAINMHRFFAAVHLCKSVTSLGSLLGWELVISSTFRGVTLSRRKHSSPVRFVSVLSLKPGTSGSTYWSVILPSVRRPSPPLTTNAKPLHAPRLVCNLPCWPRPPGPLPPQTFAHNSARLALMLTTHRWLSCSRPALWSSRAPDYSHPGLTFVTQRCFNSRK